MVAGGGTCRRVGVGACRRVGVVARKAGRVALPRDPALHVHKTSTTGNQGKELRSVISKGMFPDVQRRSRGSATLPRHTPIRRHVSPYRFFERARINRATIPVQPV